MVKEREGSGEEERGELGYKYSEERVEEEVECRSNGIGMTHSDPKKASCQLLVAFKCFCLSPTFFARFHPSSLTRQPSPHLLSN